MGSTWCDERAILDDGTYSVNRQAAPHLTNGTNLGEDDIPHSYFPCLDSRAAAGKTWQGTEVPFKNIDLLRLWCQYHKIEPLLVFQAAWALVLQRYIGDPDVVFGFDCIQGHGDSGIPDSPYTVVSGVVARLEKCRTSLDLLSEIRTGSLAFPIYSASEGSGACKTDSSLPTLPANTCLLHRKSNQEIRPGLEESRLQQYFDSGNDFKLIVYVDIGQDDLFVALYYLSSVLSIVSSANVATVFSSAIEQLLVYEDKPLALLDLFNRRDLDQIGKWNQSLPQRVDSCVHELVLHHARSRPGAPAIDSWDGKLTYEEVDRLSFDLAKHFVQKGMRTEDLVPVCFTKSLYVVIAMLAVHRAGGAFIPLDPSHPSKRLNSIIQKADAKIVIVGPDTAGRFIGLDLTIIIVSAQLLQNLQPGATVQLPRIKPHNPALVLFTSGSTGQPKGIVQEHSSVCTSAIRHGRALNMTIESRVFQYAAFAFDVSMMDIFSTLICGGCVCMPSESERLGNFTVIMNKLRANWVFLTPSVASLLDPGDVPYVKTMVLGGEAVKEENITRWSRKVQLFNCYGPAECCACSIGQFDGELLRPSNIGRQFGGGLNWVVDPGDHDHLVPIGSVGELVVEGPTLAREYLKDMNKTRASFIETPAWSKGSSVARRMYKTGDLVRQNSDGTFEFVRRKDRQLKIRGQRVELGEVEYHLAKHPKLAVCTVLSPSSGPYADSLVAIVQPRQIGKVMQNQDNELECLSREELCIVSFDKTAIVSSLKSVLPPYMVPQHFIAVMSLPLSLSRKIDNRKVEAWLQNMKRPIESEIGFAVDSQNECALEADPIILDLCHKISSMARSFDASFLEFLKRPNCPLESISLDSIQLIALAMYIRQQFGVTVELETLNHPRATIRSISKAVRALQDSTISPLTDHRLDAAQFFQGYRTQAFESFARDKGHGHKVFLTGGTGFLGQRILNALCKDPGISRVVVHVRRLSSEQDSDQSLHRLVHSLESKEGWRREWMQKLEVWTGDLAKHKLGLSAGQWSRLCGQACESERISAIIHSGAIVNWNSSFEALKATNVDSTVELLKAAAGSPALDHFVFVSGGQQLRMTADSETEIAQEVMDSNGYSQTKFLSELLVKDYACKAAPSKQHIAVVKPGYIIGSCEDGEAQAGDYIWRLAASCVSNRAYNAADAKSWLYVSDVNRVASAVVEACSSPSTPRQAAQVSNAAEIVKILDGIPVQEFWHHFEDELGFKMQALPSDVWMERINCDIEKKREQHPLWPLLYAVKKSKGSIGALIDPAFKPTFDELRVSAALRKNIEFLKGIGAL